MAIKLSMKTLTCRADARKKLNGVDPTVSGLYRIAGVDCLLAEEEQFSAATTLQLVDLECLPGDYTMGPLKTRSKKELHQIVEGNLWWRTNPTTGITKWGSSSPNRRDKPQASLQEITPEPQQWNVTKEGTRTWNHPEGSVCLRLMTLKK